jgi:small-conductance mechanosensitive channel
MRKFGLRRAEVTPDMPFRRLIPVEKEAVVWGELQHAINARSWPKLGLPPWLRYLQMTLTFSVFAAVFLLFWKVLPVGPENGVILGLLAMAVFAIIACRVTRRFKTRIPPRYRRIRDIVPYAITSNEIKWTREQVSAIVKLVVQEQLGISDEKYWEDAHFVNDFGMDR